MDSSTLAPSQPVAPATVAPPPPADTLPAGSGAPPRWHPAALAAFRFCFVYFGLYVLTTQMLGSLLPIPGLGIPILQTLPPFRNLALWVGAHLFGITGPIPFQLTGSGDRTFDWLFTFSLLVVAIVAMIVWSAFGKNRRDHARLLAWFRLFLRFALGTTMLSYGLSKVVPLQMPTDTLSRLVEPFGNFSPMGVLWSSIGASPAYEMFVGLAEVCSGLLLFLPRTAPLGALMALMNSIAIFTLNMTYDVPVKLFALHLALLALVLIAPNAPRYLSFFLLRRSTTIRSEPALSRSAGTRRALLAAQIAFGAYVLLLGAYGRAMAWSRIGGGVPRSPLYGIWDIQTMTVDSQPSLLLLSDSTHWRRWLVQRPAFLQVQRMNDSFMAYGSVLDTAAHTLTLTAFDSTRTRSTLAYQRPAADRLLVDGPLGGHVLHLELVRHDPASYPLHSRGFHWISEYPFNR